MLLCLALGPTVYPLPRPREAPVPIGSGGRKPAQIAGQALTQSCYSD